MRKYKETGFWISDKRLLLLVTDIIWGLMAIAHLMLNSVARFSLNVAEIFYPLQEGIIWLLLLFSFILVFLATLVLLAYNVWMVLEQKKEFYKDTL